MNLWWDGCRCRGSGGAASPFRTGGPWAALAVAVVVAPPLMMPCVAWLMLAAWLTMVLNSPVCT